MANIEELYQTADWKTEKHVPVITLTKKSQSEEPVNLHVSVGKKIPHPNTTEHHIGWIEVYFLPSSEKFPHTIGRFEFSSHGASSQGPNTSSVYTQPEVACTLNTKKSGTVLATSFCNIHGLWTSSMELKLED